MKKIVDSAYELIGETPILNAKKFRISEKLNCFLIKLYPNQFNSFSY